MPLSWNEIRDRAIKFSNDWASETREHAEAKTFWDDFFHVFGLRRRQVASFEEPVKNLGGHFGFIDLFWKGILLAEHKSRGKDLGKAQAQAMDYIQDLQREGRANEVPRYVILSDFARIAMHDLEEQTSIEFALDEFHKNVHCLAFIPGYKQHRLEAEDPINIQAVELMGALHDALDKGGYTGHQLERMLVRILFCAFAEDTGIFEREAFRLFLEDHTKEDGSDLGAQLQRFFHILNTAEEKRQTNLQEELRNLPYVNGDLFAESLGFAEFNRDMRNRLLDATRFDWSRISPAVFGALFQAVMQPKERRQIGAHYTSERDILKVIRPLFLDRLRDELKKARNDKPKLRRLHDKLAALRLLDPACGCGNFLVVAYRELRLLEIELLKRLQRGERVLDITHIARLDVDQMYGIEIEEWPARIAEVALWLMDHQMNIRTGEVFGQYFVRLPLKKSPHIANANALSMDWNDLLPATACTHVFGNPPFVGKRFRSTGQSADLSSIWQGVGSNTKLDYVTCWYWKTCEYISHNHAITAAFVSTNSICQGEQVPIMWPELLKRFGLKIHFAHRTFEWESEARGRAHVHVVIVGFSTSDCQTKVLFEYSNGRGEPTSHRVHNISPYLFEGSDSVVYPRRTPLSPILPIVYGSMPNDGGHLVLSSDDRQELLAKHPEIHQCIRLYLGSREFINSLKRWCLWLVDTPPNIVRDLRPIRERVEQVREFRLSSTRSATRKLARTPAIFGEIRQPNTDYLLIPKNPSCRRRYLTVEFMPPDVIASDQCLIIPNAGLYHFGIISSAMHIAWTATIGGRLKSDYRYSNTVVYNNYPWPQDPTEKQVEAVEQAAQTVLDTRKRFPDATFADLYDPVAMPATLTKAHVQLDKAVDRSYRAQRFPNERKRVEYLFTLYEKLTAPLLPRTKRWRG